LPPASKTAKTFYIARANVASSDQIRTAGKAGGFTWGFSKKGKAQLSRAVARLLALAVGKARPNTWFSLQ